jgi:hypothetical protein
MLNSKCVPDQQKLPTPPNQTDQPKTRAPLNHAPAHPLKPKIRDPHVLQFPRPIPSGRVGIWPPVPAFACMGPPSQRKFPRRFLAPLSLRLRSFYEFLRTLPRRGVRLEKRIFVCPSCKGVDTKELFDIRKYFSFFNIPSFSCNVA